MSVRKITVKSGNEEFTLDVTEEEYRNYFRPWWQQKKREQRNREAMEQNGYTEESYKQRWQEARRNEREAARLQAAVEAAGQPEAQLAETVADAVLIEQVNQSFEKGME